MNTHNFQGLTYEAKKTYLINLFLSVKDIYPIYAKIHALLSTRDDLHEDVLDAIYAAVGSIASETEKLNGQHTTALKAAIREAESIDQHQSDKILSDIEKYFI